MRPWTRFVAVSLMPVAIMIELALGMTNSASSYPRVESMAVDAKIEVVWPRDRDGNPATFATQQSVNIEAYLFRRGTLDPVPCDYPNPVMLLWTGEAISRGPSLVPAQSDQAVPGQRVLRTEGGRTFPVWIWEEAYIYGREVGMGPNNRTYYFLQVEGADYRTNVWAHGYDKVFRHYDPLGLRTPDERPPTTVDAAIGAILPHEESGDLSPLTEPLFILSNVRHILYTPMSNIFAVDIGVDLAHHEPSTRVFGGNSVGFGFGNSVRLLQSLNDGYLEVVRSSADAILSVLPQGGFPRPRWAFSDVAVATRDPSNRHYFAIEVAGTATHTTIIGYGENVLTNFPAKDQPTSSCTQTSAG